MIEMSDITFKTVGTDCDLEILNRVLHNLVKEEAIFKDISIEKHLDNLKTTGKTFITFKCYIPIKMLFTANELMSLFYMKDLNPAQFGVTSQLFLNARPVGFEQQVKIVGLEVDDELKYGDDL